MGISIDTLLIGHYSLYALIARKQINYIERCNKLPHYSPLTSIMSFREEVFSEESCRPLTAMC